ncbi:hypothetical protein Mapa_006697 [Marchantia paleacea]|nr:hypothetical protein Mapa_006697 [Marchantia paleacea]
MFTLRSIPEANFCAQINHGAQRALKLREPSKSCGSCKIPGIGSSFISGNQPRTKEQVRFSRLKASGRVVQHAQAHGQAGTRLQADNSQMQTLELLRKGLLGEHPEAAKLREVATLDLNCLTEAAAEVRDRRKDASVVTFSPKVFIPLTRVCRDVCGYCTFSLGPKTGQAVYLTIDEVLKVARAGAAAGCSEALFTLGDKPELRYPQAKFEGLMLESISERLMEPGGPHFNSPDKHPTARLTTIEAAGEEKVPFTSGILIGIGETREERLDSLFALRELHQKYGHIQELIIQNFRAKKGTRMANAPEPPIEELTWTVAMARLMFGSAMSIQAPPNLTPNVHLEDESSWRALIASGINDWGGVSPVTIDWVNPEAAWPHLETLSAATSEAGKLLVPRLPLYPEYIRQASTWVEPSITKWVLMSSNSLGYARAESWSPGLAMDESMIASSHQGSVAVENDGTMKVSRSTTEGVRTGSSEITDLVQRAQIGEQLAELEITKLLEAVGPDFEYIRSAADALRSRLNGDEVSYVVNRNINYTNVCSYRCQFCAFSKGKTSEELRGKPYRLSLEEIARRSIEAWERGATEVCMQGGIHPEYTGETYLDILNTVRKAAPGIHVHAFSPLEVFQGASTLGISLEEYLKELKKAGLGSLPGTAAEVLDEEVRSVLCPDKINTQQWLEIMETAHSVGLRTTSTIMFGHLDHPYHWARHLLHLRNLQMRTGGFTEFVPLPFVHMEAPVFIKGRARKGPTMRDCIIMHSVARLVLYPYITNIQASWVKMGPGGVKTLLAAGCNDMGGSLMNESITRAAGASYGEELPPHEMERVILSLGRKPRQRTTLYGEAPAEQVQRSFGARPLEPIR